ncbi:pentapeptide repeat-containing protein [Streptomyces radicis]|uniref:Pentapeptide repeat-containing protein n=1 Tax=Streptomyces radicis TaxID=1750517 RepID=A0A3A9WVX7_9ACTN|nr:pentapeptide repeat-containing protein [Streptomyces radicis]RKN11966.1 hypothetical protein D7319_03400 [Streptomyces radicis]RKN25983.1 hypothetical protein D7318_07080 [Streptomyces radicis]
MTSLEGRRGRVAEFHYGDMDGRITGLKTQQVQLATFRVDSVEFTGCELSALRWSDSKVTGAVFRDCKLMGATIEDVTLDNVVFESCKLDYSTLTRVRAAGPMSSTAARTAAWTCVATTSPSSAASPRSSR